MQYEENSLDCIKKCNLLFCEKVNARKFKQVTCACDRSYTLHTCKNVISFATLFQPFELNAAAVSITSNVTYILTSLCYCDVVEEHFKSTSATCASDGQVLLYTATLSYASTTGNVTGSTLAAQLLAWFLVQNSTTLGTNDGALRVYPALKTPTCIPLQSSTVSIQAGLILIAGGLMGGLLLGVVLTALVESFSIYM